MEAGWRLKLDHDLAIIPYAGISLMHLLHRGCTEVKAEDLNLQVRDFEANTLVPELGIRLKFSRVNHLPLILNAAGLAYAPRLPLDDRKIEASLANQGGGSFFAFGRDEVLHVFMSSLGLSTTTIGGFDLQLGYAGNLADGLTAHSFTAALSCRF
jgi:uncharacterized protein with beta-barrel porin domain